MKILKVDMTEGKIDSMPVPEGKVLGGRGMIDHLMADYGSATAHPLSPEALFIAAIGVLGGSAAPQAHRISVGGKSPLTGGIVVDEPLSKEGQVEKNRQSQILTTAMDCTGLCLFTSLSEAFGVLTSMINALIGTNLSEDDYVQMGKDTLKLERAFNLEAGIAPEADKLPDWMRTEPLPPLNEVFDVPQEELDEFWNF